MVGHLGHYRILGELGEGGMAKVYLAEDTHLGRRVALKVLAPEVAADAERLARFEREARVLASLNHPGIVTVFSVEQCEGVRFFTMELVEGESLDALIPAAGLPPEQLLAIAAPLVEALAAAHERGLVHRDLKPRNVMVTPEGRVKVLDFGLAKVRPSAGGGGEDRRESQELTTEGLLLGTVPYMAPEQVQGKELDARSDIFSLGAVLYELATGRRPFEGETAADLLAAILRGSPPPLAARRPDLPRDLARIIHRCLEKDPRRRPQSALDLANQLEEIARGAPEGIGEERALASIAVLPFADLSPGGDQEYFCDGIAEELIHALGKVQGLRVAARASSFRFRGTAVDLAKVGSELAVETVVTGSVRKAGERLRVTAELVNVADGYDRWSGRYDRHLEDVFAIQEEIAESITEALRLTLSPLERREMGKGPTRDLGAYDYYLRGRKYFSQYRRRAMEFALEMFARAIELDPGFARAYAGIADCASFLYANAERREEHLARALEASGRALELDPELAEAHVARGVALSYEGRPQAADEAFDTALRLDPDLWEASYFYARHSFSEGRCERAIGLYERAMEVRPDDFQAPLLMAQLYDDLGRTGEAEATRRRGVAVVEEHVRLHPEDSRAFYMGANGLVALGETERGLAWARRALELDPEEPMVLYNLACIYALAGEVEEAIDCLLSCLRHGFSYREWIEHDSNLDPIRDHPRYRELKERFDASLEA